MAESQRASRFLSYNGEEELLHARETLDACGWAADYIVTHECPASLRELVGAVCGIRMRRHDDRLIDFLDEVDGCASFRQWFFGHYHYDARIDAKHTMLMYKPMPIDGWPRDGEDGEG